MNMRERVDDLVRRRAQIEGMGGAAKIERQHARGKLTARERLARFFDGGAYFEVGMHGTEAGRPPGSDPSPAPDSPPNQATPADAVICGYGKVDRRLLCPVAYAFTVYGGSIAPLGETQVTPMRLLAL